uniref:RRP15-like protein n=1 Tax=Romanomermis culicivorax TaxID=13658 RepID=A0A915HWR9_ROMCU
MQSMPQVIIKTEYESESDEATASDDAKYSQSEVEEEFIQKPKSILKKRKANAKSPNSKEVDSTRAHRKKSQKTERYELFARVKPDPVSERESERKFIAVATKGIVQLFNAVKQHQSSVGKSLSTTKGVRNAEKVLAKSTRKQNFVNKLANNSRKIAVNEEYNEDDANKRKRTRKQTNDDSEDVKWGVFKDDFLTTE